MSEPIVYIDRSEIRAGKLEELRTAVRELVDFIAANNPYVLSYGIDLDGEANRMTVVAVHPDAPAMEHHMDVGGPAFRGFSDLVDLREIEVYGRVSEAVLKQLGEKAQMLGGARVLVREPYAAFARVEARPAVASSTEGEG